MDEPGRESAETAVETLMTPLPRAIEPEGTLAEAAACLWRLRLGCLPVVEDSPQGARVVGLLTEMDLLRAAYDSIPHAPRRS